jgi:hypothetical protein
LSSSPLLSVADDHRFVSRRRRALADTSQEHHSVYALRGQASIKASPTHESPEVSGCHELLDESGWISLRSYLAPHLGALENHRGGTEAPAPERLERGGNLRIVFYGRG